MAQLQTVSAAGASEACSSDEQTFLEHLHELRKRFFFVAIFLVLGASLGYTFHSELIHILLAPLRGEKLVYLTPGGGFDFIFKVSLYFGVAVAIPVIIYQLYMYLSPMMKQKHSRKFGAFLVLLSVGLAFGGIMFGYLVALPAALHFLIGFAGDYIEANLTAPSYLNFVIAYSLGLAALFQLPLVLVVVNSVAGPLKPSKLLSTEPYVLLGSFVLAAMITPTPDIINQIIVAAPVMVVYQFGVIVVILQNRSAAKRKRRTINKTASNGIIFKISDKEEQAAMQVLRRQPVSAARPQQSTIVRPISRPVRTMEFTARPRVVARPAPRAIDRQLPVMNRRPAPSVGHNRQVIVDGVICSKNNNVNRASNVLTQTIGNV